MQHVVLSYTCLSNHIEMGGNDDIQGARVCHLMYISPICNTSIRLRPYHPEHARSRPISEAKQGRAWLVLGWETAWEYQVL